MGNRACSQASDHPTRIFRSGASRPGRDPRQTRGVATRGPSEARLFRPRTMPEGTPLTYPEGLMFHKSDFSQEVYEDGQRLAFRFDGKCLSSLWLLTALPVGSADRERQRMPALSMLRCLHRQPKTRPLPVANSRSTKVRCRTREAAAQSASGDRLAQPISRRPGHSPNLIASERPRGLF